MSLRLLLREHPNRSIALTTESHALIFRHSTASDLSVHGTYKSSPHRCMVEFSSLTSVNLADYRTLTTLGVHGTLGLINIETDIFLCVISGAARVATVRPGETVQRITSVEFR